MQSARVINHAEIMLSQETSQGLQSTQSYEIDARQRDLEASSPEEEQMPCLKIKSEKDKSKSKGHHANLSGVPTPAGNASRKPKKTKKKTTRSERAGLQFPVGRVGKRLKQQQYAQRLGAGAPVYLGAVLEYLTAEVLELAGNAAKEHRKSRIVPRHIQLAIRNDEELSKFLSNVTIPQGGVLPNVHSVLLPKKQKDTPAEPSQNTSPDFVSQVF